MGKLIDLTGKKFNHLIVLHRDTERKESCACWVCKCECCGRIVSRKSRELLSFKFKTCGCGHPMQDVQGQSRDRLYGIWIKMKHRCYNKSNSKYINYGSRGITICDKWLKSYNNFRDWAMENGYTDELTIDRIDVNGNYEPSNCRWVTLAEQAKNTTRTVYISVCGETLCKIDWSNRLGLRRRCSVQSIIKALKDLYNNEPILVKGRNYSYVV